MNFIRNKIAMLGIVIICLVCFQQIKGQQNIIKLRQVRSVFVAPIEYSERKKNDFSDVLKAELKRMNFVIAEDKETADAILRLKNLEVEITIHGARDDTDKWFYEFELSSQSGEVIWRTTVKFLTKGNELENDKIASQKVVEHLYYNRLKALKKSKSSKEK